MTDTPANSRIMVPEPIGRFFLGPISESRDSKMKKKDEID